MAELLRQRRQKSASSGRSRRSCSIHIAPA